MSLIKTVSTTDAVSVRVDLPNLEKMNGKRHSVFEIEKMSLPLQGVGISWDKIDKGSYLRKIDAIKGLDYLAFNKKITIFVGENGSGKSTMLEAIAVNYAKEYSQFILVTHSPILLGIPGAEILSFDDGQIHPIEYEDTDSYRIMKMFIENKEQLLKRLLSDEGG